MTRKVLLVDDERAVRDALGQTLELADLEPVLAGSFVAAKDYITPDFDGVIVTDVRMPGRDGFHLLGHVQAVDRDLPVILLTGEADVPLAVKAMGEGAHAFLEKPCASAELLDAVRGALQVRASTLALRAEQSRQDGGDAAARMIYGISEQAQKLRVQVRAVARTRAEVLVLGEPGTGIPKVAEVIHLLSPDAQQAFVKRAGGALDPDGVHASLAQAEGGSLFIDEVAQLSLAAQSVLFERLDAGSPARVIAGSTTALEEAVEQGRFSADLFYRLDLMRVRIPALRERPDDIPVLFQRYLTQACEQAALPVPDVTPDVIAHLMAQDWSGNARALMSSAMRYALGVAETSDAQGGGLVEQLARVERSLLIEALKRNRGRAGQTAEALKLPRKTFYDKLARYGLRAEDFRD